MILAAVEVVIEPAGTPWWIPWLSVAGAIVIFLAGVAFGPLTKAYEAQFLEQRQTRRQFQELAHDVMGRLRERSQRFDARSAPHFAHVALDFRDLLISEKFKLHPTDRAACQEFIGAIFAVNRAVDAEDFAWCVNAVYDRYLDVRHPLKRWNNRRKIRAEFFLGMRRSDFLPTQHPEFVDDPESDVSH